MAITSDQKKAAANLGGIAGYNAQSTKNQLSQARTNFNLADAQNAALAETQYDQNSRKAAGERFVQARKLQSSASDVTNAAGNALNGSGFANLVRMLRDRTDWDNSEVLNTLTQNQNAVRNSLDESINANVLARNDAAMTAEHALRGIEADMSAQLNNINPGLYVAPGTGAANFSSKDMAKNNTLPAHLAALAGYILPANAAQQAAALNRPATSAPAASSPFVWQGLRPGATYNPWSTWQAQTIPER